MKNRMLALTAITSTFLALLPATTFAHVGAGQVAGFAAGFTHPLGGLDHVLAMLAIGLWAAQTGGRWLWLAPSTFLCAMLIGGWLGLAGITVPHVEHGIAASLLVTGLLVAGVIRLTALPAMVLVSLFALFHGHAHGAEMPPALHVVGYSAGFMLATAMLHAVGIASFYGLRLVDAAAATRMAGYTLVAVGMLFAAA